MGMHPPTEQLIRDYLNRLSVAARGRLGISQRQSLLDRTRARIEAECGGINGASAVEVRKALAGLGDPIVLVELEAYRADSGTSGAYPRYEPSVAGNGNREMAAEEAHVSGPTKGNQIGEDLLVTGGPNGSKPVRGGGSIRSLLAGFAAGQRRRRAKAAADPVARATPGGNPGAGHDGGTGRGSGLVPAPRQPVGSEKLGSPDPSAARASGQPSGGAASAPPGAAPTPPGGGVLARLIRGLVGAVRGNTVEVLAILLLGVGGAVYPPIWLVGAALALPSKKWDIRDKFVGITLPVFLLVIGTVVIIVLGGQHATIADYAYEAWLGAGRLSRVLAVAGAAYLAWGLRRGRRKPRQPPWNVPRRIG